MRILKEDVSSGTVRIQIETDEDLGTCTTS